MSDLAFLALMTGIFAVFALPVWFSCPPSVTPERPAAHGR